ncbi:MAG: adenylate/guanylate cyclase domain-containing protein, partial [Deltaproteobacteria bacterium]|nr:adenylate/guanylate cyclase domain-containing protein [Deltaproteobacteria bacterium]
LDLVRVKGKEQPVAIHELLGSADYQIARYAQGERYAAGLGAYRAGRLGEARAAFAAFAEANPEDPVARLYLERLTQLGDAVPADWDGVFVHTRK